ncbi:Predicted oxidoreductase [Actinopolymorpha cephalotaxi]|uniref:Predicted oxidoreductase n=1 Tax=Actinopolymorpha cephalotaxi TaxID=504797 RepID=A0A1I2WWA8_9ACTN|nr:aldo/keto reductase [Actinopolymorpha cephalotaxi]NYH85136.1 aryl-alcohol dehydrogenase-like predicted oxidoreductase [Actinopolymorpha cephalotaxi]SFH05007.1 Predicted oxidoreductase [Actinopolymorpha cephalotaxi]
MEYRNVSGLDVSQLCLGTMMFGTRVDERTSFDILDRFVDAGGTFLDTANCYQFWEGDGQGHESEELLGRWLHSRGLASGAGREKVVVATKVGARPITGPGRGDFPENREGLSAEIIRGQIEVSLRRLGLDHVDLYYSHHEDRSVPLEETVRAFGEIVQAGKAKALGVSNEPAWRVERARQIATHTGLPSYTVVQQRHTYLQPKPGFHDEFMPVLGEELLDYVRSEPDLTLVAYSPLLSGAYSGRSDKPIPPPYAHPASAGRLAALKDVATELGATPNQVVLAWMLASTPSILPLFSASSVTQLEESLGALELKLSEEQLTRLDQS